MGCRPAAGTVHSLETSSACFIHTVARGHGGNFMFRPDIRDNPDFTREVIKKKTIIKKFTLIKLLKKINRNNLIKNV